MVSRGGEGSGNFDHKGRPGEVGGSSGDGIPAGNYAKAMQQGADDIKKWNANKPDGKLPITSDKDLHKIKSSVLVPWESTKDGYKVTSRTKSGVLTVFAQWNPDTSKIDLQFTIPWISEKKKSLGSFTTPDEVNNAANIFFFRNQSQ